MKEEITTGRFSERAVLVTGSGGDIGRSIAMQFAAEGAAVGVVDVDSTRISATLDAIHARGGRAVGLEADVSATHEVDSVIDTAVREFGRLDVLCNNAGILPLGSVEMTEEGDWDRCFAINAKGPFLCSKAALPHLLNSASGAIVNIASIGGLVGVVGMAAYSASKGALISLTRSMALETAGKGIRVNAICPGTVLTSVIREMAQARGDGDGDRGIALMTEKYPVGRLAAPEEIAKVAVFLASDDASFMTGSIVTADGGMTAQ